LALRRDLLSSQYVTRVAAGLVVLALCCPDDCRRGAGVASDPFAIRHSRGVVLSFKLPSRQTANQR